MEFHDNIIIISPSKWADISQYRDLYLLFDGWRGEGGLTASLKSSVTFVKGLYSIIINPYMPESYI